VQDVLQAATLYPDAIAFGHPQTFDEQQVRVDCRRPSL
jgi:hypothetical protein